MNILIVEDSRLELQRICRMVGEAAPEACVFSFDDSAKAQQEILLHSIRPDVAFLDIEMPAPNGRDLAQLLMTEFPKVNIIFTTAYASYMQQAFELFVSGYLLKPFSGEDVRQQLEHLRYPVETERKAFYARTIGEFELFYEGKPVPFSLARSKEALAYLIARRGSSVTKRELFSVLFEDAPYSPGKQDHMKKIMQALRSSLAQTGGEALLIHTRNSYAVDMSLLSTDMAEREKRGTTAFMEQYSWADGWQL